jgi:hypothetical protein
MEDLLRAQFQNQASLALFNGMVMVNLQLFLYQINKKYVKTYETGSLVLINIFDRFFV